VAEQMDYETMFMKSAKEIEAYKEKQRQQAEDLKLGRGKHAPKRVVV